MKKASLVLIQFLLIATCFAQTAFCENRCVESGVYGVVSKIPYYYTDNDGVRRKCSVSVVDKTWNALGFRVDTPNTIIEKVVCHYSNMNCGHFTRTYMVNEPDYKHVEIPGYVVAMYEVYVKHQFYGIVKKIPCYYTDNDGVRRKCSVNVVDNTWNALGFHVDTPDTIIEKVVCHYSDMNGGRYTRTYMVNKPDYKHVKVSGSVVATYEVYVKRQFVDINKFTPNIQSQLRSFGEFATSNIVPASNLRHYMTFFNVTYKDLLSIVNNLNFLEGLSICEGYFEEIPSGIQNFSELRRLTIIGSGLTKIPTSLYELKYLSELTLSANNLSMLPSGIERCSSLSSIDVSFNNLVSLPDAVCSLSNLRSLDFSGNRLKQVPNSLGNLTRLRDLNLGGNQLTQIPSSLGSLVNLESLYLYDNDLSQLPESLKNLTRLTTFDLFGNNLIQIPEYIGSFVSLETLRLGGKSLTKLPDSLRSLINLREFCLFDTNVTQLPVFFEKFTKLSSLDLSGNKITELPDIFENFTKLWMITLCNNNLTTLPASLASNSSVTIKLSPDSIKWLPQEFKSFPPENFEPQLDIDALVAATPPKRANMTPIINLLLQ